jgi:hypothetical protein
MVANRILWIWLEKLDTIAEAKTINTGDNRRTEIQFSIIGQFHATKLKFSSLKECIYVEL